MATDIVMPRLSDSMEEGTVLQWMKSVGDRVALGEELVEIETDKANMVFEADAAGTLVEILAAEGETRAIGEVIARVGEAAEIEAAGDGAPKAPAATAPAEPAAAATPTGAATEAPPAPASAPGPDGRLKASPLARRIARERGVDLAALSGSGPGGRIIKADVERAPAPGAAPEPERGLTPPAPKRGLTPPAPSPESAKGAVEVLEPTRLQRTVARRMAESKATAPHFYLEASVDMSRCAEARARLAEAAREGEPPPSFNDLVVKASALALREFPRANGAYRDGRFELYERVNVGIAVAAREALVVPTIFDADRKGLRRIAAESRALAARVREGRITPPELSGATFTVSNLGMYGVRSFHPVINLPQAGILAVGAITPTPVIRDGELASAPTMGLTLACDHRILYGAEGAEFLARIRALLEEPLGLAI